MDATAGLTARTSPDTACLRRLKFGAIRRRADLMTTNAMYTNEAGERFRVTASAPPVDRAALREVTLNLLGALEIVADSRPFHEGLESAEIVKGARRDNDLDGVTIEMTLVEPREPDRAVVCSYYFDPPITKGKSPHRYKPDGAAVTAQVYCWKGKVRLRIYRGNDPTDRISEASAGDETKKLGTQIATPRPHVRALTDEAGYGIWGGWEQI